jgi:hypothetical protein
MAAGSPTGFWRMLGHPALRKALRNHVFCKTPAFLLSNKRWRFALASRQTIVLTLAHPAGA